MADVRLTATNPEDSSVVPVACDAAGRLLLEEPQVIEGPPGPPGEQGPPGQNGDPFSGNFAGDVTFGGSASFAGGNAKINSNGQYESYSVVAEQASYKIRNVADTEWVTLLRGDGSATFAGIIKVGNRAGGEQNRSGSDIPATGGIYTQILATDSDDKYAIRYTKGRSTGGGPGEGDKFVVKADGSCTFAGNKAGFTAEGYLWCTTRRGDTVILDATSQGVGVWADYTPTTRAEEIRDKLDAIPGDTGEMPADTQ